MFELPCLAEAIVLVLLRAMVLFLVKLLLTGAASLSSPDVSAFSWILLIWLETDREPTDPPEE